MKKTALGLLLLSTSVAQAQDIFLQTRLEQNTLSALIDKTRVLLNNAEIGDHMTGEVTYADDINFSLAEIPKDANYTKFQGVFTSLFKMDLANAVIRIRIPKIGYKVEKLSAKPNRVNVHDPVLELDATAYVSGITTTLPAGVDMDLMIVNPKTNKADSYLTAHLVPTMINVPNTLEPVSFDVSLDTIRDQQFSYNLKGYDLHSIPEYVNRNIGNITLEELDKKIPLSANSLTVNPVTVRLNSLTRTVEFETLKPLLQKRFDAVISAVVSSIGKSLQKTLGPKILKSVFSNKTRSDLIVKNDSLYTRFLTAKFTQPAIDQVSLDVAGELCTAELFKQYADQCAQHAEYPEPVREIEQAVRDLAKREITENLAQSKSDLVLSMSEEYLNRLLSLTIQANLWDESLEKNNLALGPKGAFVVFDQRTQAPALFLDVLYKGSGKGAEKMFISENRPLRFPLRISSTLDFVDVAGIPHMLIKTRKVLSTVDEIVHGIPEYQLPSRLIRGFRKKVARMILDMSKEIENQTAVDLDLPVLKNIDLDKTWHEVSPFGRVNLFFKF